jgi:hypothetical protein
VATNALDEDVPAARDIREALDPAVQPAAERVEVELTSIEAPTKTTSPSRLAATMTSK